jgi:alpha-L-rhamnosidase
MLRSLQFLSIFIILLFSGCSDKSGPMLYSLRCENLDNPLGIDTTSPRFSWKIKSDRNGMAQKAFQIIVASDSMLLDEEKADLWNSGKVLSPASVSIPYQGVKLAARSIGYWRVRIWDENDEVSEWSMTARFSIGLLDRNDWEASYIGLSPDAGDVEFPQLRKTFNLTGIEGKVFLYVNSLGYHEVYINGEKVNEDVLSPAVSQFNKRSLIKTYNVTNFTKEGKNDLILWLGRGWYSKVLPGVVYEGPLVKAQMEQLNNGEWETIISTDSSWLGRASEYSRIGKWTAGDFGGEKIDGSRVLKDLSANGLDETDWFPVRKVSVPEHEVTAQMVESNRIMQTFKPDSIFSIDDTSWLVDMGKNLTGWIEINFPELQPGQEVIMEYSDFLDKNGCPADQNQEDRYSASGKGKEVFRNKFNYHGFRYVKISNLINRPQKEDISASLIHPDYRLASTFECSDSDLNNIHNMIFYTLRCLSLGGYLVDCPQLERLGYGGDGNASTQTAQTMFDLSPLYCNWLQAWADCIRNDGGMPHTAPNPYAAGGGPYWCGFIITASWKTYLNYGDIRVLEKYYPVMQKWLGYVDKYSPDVLLQPWPETDYRVWYLGDWASPEGVNDKSELSVRLVTNCFISICYETMQRIARVLGKTDDIDKYKYKNEHLKARIHQTFFNPTDSIYGSGSQIDLSIALLSGIVPDSLTQIITGKLQHEILNKRKGHIACGLVGIPVFTEWVVKNGASDLMYSVLKKKDYPGYLYMIKNGATTTWEHWNGARSRIHNCYNGIGSWFYQAVSGIRPDEELSGYQQVIIEPQAPSRITWANATKETPYGTIVVNWTKAHKIFKAEINIPVGCRANFILPDSITGYRMNGKGHRLKDGEPSVINIESGKYKLSYSTN